MELHCSFVAAASLPTGPMGGVFFRNFDAAAASVVEPRQLKDPAMGKQNLPFEGKPIHIVIMQDLWFVTFQLSYHLKNFLHSHRQFELTVV